MKYCTKCGHQMQDTDMFCNQCGNPANPYNAQTNETVNTQTTQNTEPQYTQATTPQYAQAPAAAPLSEQACLDKLATGLKHERLCFKIVGIVSLVLAAIMLVSGIIMTVAGAYTAGEINDYNHYSDYIYDLDDFFSDFDDDDFYSYNYYYNTYAEDEAAALMVVGILFIVYGVVFLPVAIVNLVIKSKVGKYRDKLYTDCTDGVKHASSVGTIVLGAIFNSIALIFIIINFVFMKKNRETFERIKANQADYNSQQF